jgi:hypothetical protein
MQMSTNTLLSKTRAAMRVPTSAPMKTMLAMRRSRWIMFFICLLKPMRKPVLREGLHTLRGSGCSRSSKLWRTWQGYQWPRSKWPQTTEFTARSLPLMTSTQHTTDGEPNHPLRKAKRREARNVLLLFLAKEVFEFHFIIIKK